MIAFNAVCSFFFFCSILLHTMMCSYDICIVYAHVEHFRLVKKTIFVGIILQKEGEREWERKRELLSIRFSLKKMSAISLHVRRRKLQQLGREHNQRQYWGLYSCYWIILTMKNDVVSIFCTLFIYFFTFFPKLAAFKSKDTLNSTNTLEWEKKLRC